MLRALRTSDQLSSRARRAFRFLSLAALAVCIGALAGASAAFAQFRTADRIVEPVAGARFSAIRGGVHPAARPEFEQGSVDPAMRLGRVTMFFQKTPEQQAGLETLLRELQDTSSPLYHRWLSPEEFGARFGLSPNDLDKIVAWLRTQGLAIEQVSRSRTWVAFSGTARQIEAALRTDLHRYSVRGEPHFANRTAPSVPAAFAGVVLGFRGLNDFRMKPRGVRKLRPRFTSEISGDHFLAPDDLATIYNLKPLYSSGIDGTGQTIAVVGQSAIQIADVQTFRTLSGLPANNPQIILVPQSVTGQTDPGMVEGDIDEAYLDVEWAGAVARNATLLYVYSENVLDAFTYVIDQNLAPVLSISYGLCEGGTDGFTQSDANILASIGQQANAGGITIVAPSGDAGAADCDFNVAVAEQGLAVDLPGALPYATSVGGTRFNEGTGTYWSPTNNSSNGSALSYIPEIAWNDSDSTGLAASGGGSSIYFPKPGWQTGTGVPSSDQRHVPDIAFSASANHDGYLVCSRDATTSEPSCVNGFRKTNDDLTVFGGTSAGVPVFAGIVALINQAANTPNGQGNVNYILYPLAAHFPPAFHDVTSGDNIVPCRTTPPPASPDCPTTGPDAGFLGFTAGAGYDRVTGLGSLDAHSVVTAWTSVSSTPASKASTDPDFQLALSPPNLTVSPGGSGTSQVSVTSINGFAAAVSLSCSVPAALTGVTCSISGTGATRTLTVNASGSFGTVAPRGSGGDIQWPGTWMLYLCIPGGMWAAARVANRRRMKWAPVFACAALLLISVGCNGGNGNGDNGDPIVPSSTGSVTVQGASGAITHTAQLSVTID
jgi:subtilase family serine protease